MLEFNNIILDLQIIKQIKENDKLGLIKIPGSQKLFVDNNNYLSPLSRWYYGYNRDDTIEYLENLINKIENISQFLNNGSHYNMSQLLSKNLEDCKIGIENLKKTYEFDSISFAKLNMISDKIDIIKKNLKLIESVD